MKKIPSQCMHGYKEHNVIPSHRMQGCPLQICFPPCAFRVVREKNIPLPVHAGFSGKNISLTVHAGLSGKNNISLPVHAGLSGNKIFPSLCMQGCLEKFFIPSLGMQGGFFAWCLNPTRCRVMKFTLLHMSG